MAIVFSIKTDMYLHTYCPKSCSPESVHIIQYRL